MENNEYYTPTIEEFHVGFEFEANINNHWIRTQITDWYDGLEGEYRVKYLDQSDIESLGWKKNEDVGLKETNKLYFFIKDNNYDNSIYIEYNLESKHMLLTRGRKYSFTKFEGTIKNKYELIKLMQQLNII